MALELGEREAPVAMAAVLSSQQYHRRIEETRNSVQTFLRRGDPKEKGCVGPEGGDGRQVVGGRITVSIAWQQRRRPARSIDPAPRAFPADPSCEPLAGARPAPAAPRQAVAAAPPLGTTPAG